MLRFNSLRIGFLLGVSLVVAAIIYFFAANWGGMDRVAKIAVSAGFVLLFYGLSFAMSKLRVLPGRSYRDFLTAVFLTAGCISFGAAAALLGQIYNSHADSYGLFLVWSVPALLLAWITRLNAFYLLSYVLLHLALWFFFYPSSLSFDYSNVTRMAIGATFALINLILFVLCERNLLRSAPVKLAAFAVFHISLLLLTNSFVYDTYGVWMNIPCAAAIAAGFYYFIRVRLDKTYLTLNALAASAFAVFKFVELAIRYASTGFYVLGLVFVALLLTANVLFFRYLNRLGPPASGTEGKSADDTYVVAAEPDQGPIAPTGSSSGGENPLSGPDDGGIASTGGRNGMLAAKIVSTIVMIIGVVIGSISLIGLTILASGGNIDPQYMLYVLSLLFVIPMILLPLPRINAVVRYTVLTIGYIAGIVSIAWAQELFLSILFMVLSIAGWLRLEGRFRRFFTYALMVVNAAIIIFQLLGPAEIRWELLILILAVVNAFLYFSHAWLPEGPLRGHIRESGLFFTLLFLFWLTFFGDLYPYSYAMFNVINFAVVTASVFVFIRRKQTVETVIGLIFWFAFIAFKYYDLLWSLLHKSFTLALLGIIVLSVTYVIARRTETPGTEAGIRFLPHRRSRVLIAIVVLLQFGFLGYQTATSEHLLRTGTSVKLEITPLDPRSLLQGDYVRLNYSISTPPQKIADELDQRRSGSMVKVVLSPDGRGVHVFNRLYKAGETLADGEVVINGKISGYRFIYYGIETWFVPEGSGIETERNARFAYIRVGAGGNALLERLTKE